MSRINTNIAALTATRHLQRNYGDLSLRLERLSTGLRINHGRDDPAGLIVSERLRLDIRAVHQAIENSERASNVILTTEGALNEANALLLDLQALVVEAANKGALTDEEISANQLQVDSILASIDRIANTTSFGSKKLLDGTDSYLLSTIPTSALASIQLFSARIPKGASRNVTVRVTQSAQTGRVSFVGNNPGGVSTTSASTIELRGNLGTEILSFASGTTLSEIQAAINNSRDVTGVSAVLSSPASAGAASALVLNSLTFGSDAFVSVTPITGDFIQAGTANQSLRGVGVDVGVLIDGQAAQGSGLHANVRSAGLDTRISLTSDFAQTLSATSFTITGGGTFYQLGPEVSPNGQVHLGFASVHTTDLGNSVVGRLNTLRSGGGNDLSSGNLLNAQEIMAAAIDQVSAYRGRLGNLQRNTIETNIRSQGITLENLTASESVIRDADMAEELAALSRAQVLVQSTQSTLQIANTVPNLVLSLLQ